MGFSVIDIQSPFENYASGGLSEICGWLWEQLSHAERVFQSTSSGERNLLEVRFFHQGFLMD